MQLDLEFRVGAWARLRVDASNASDGKLRSFIDAPVLLGRHFADERNFAAYQRYVAKLMAMFGGTMESAHAVTFLEKEMWEKTRMAKET